MIKMHNLKNNKLLSNIYLALNSILLYDFLKNLDKFLTLNKYR